MDKYKICPSCGEKCEPTFFECLFCETDLTRTKVTDDESEKQKLKQEEKVSPPSPALEECHRLCDCGEQNPPNGRKCFACGEDISDILPTVPTEPSSVTTHFVVFHSLDGQYTFQLDESSVTIGREAEMSPYLSQKSYVSRIHAQLLYENGAIYIENLSKTNFTYVNNEKITEKTKLNHGDEIGLGGTNMQGKSQENAGYFSLRIEPCT